jgi:hypothetical protein
MKTCKCCQLWEHIPHHPLGVGWGECQKAKGEYGNPVMASSGAVAVGQGMTPGRLYTKSSFGCNECKPK